MSRAALNNWQSVHDEVLRRIQTRQWDQGMAIPNESDLATEFGCARTTVNRALRVLAEAGLLDRRRKAGTRVTASPARRATLEIPLIRREIEGLGKEHGYRLIGTQTELTPDEVGAAMRVSRDVGILHLLSVHSADDAPYVFEDRWINPELLPGLDEVDFAQQNANEWLVRNAPFTRGDIGFSAASATAEQAWALGTNRGDALFSIQRTTWCNETSITHVRLVFAPGYNMQTVV